MNTASSPGPLSSVESRRKMRELKHMTFKSREKAWEPGWLELHKWGKDEQGFQKFVIQEP